MASTPRVRDLVFAVVALAGFSGAMIVAFDTPWNRMLLGFVAVFAFLAVAVTAWRAGVPYAPRRLSGVPEQHRRDESLRRWSIPVWLMLALCWFAAGWLVTNGGG